MKTAVIYIRVSSPDQAELGYSLGVQKEECNKKAKSLGAEEAVVFIDEGDYGSIMERPVLIAAIDQLRTDSSNFFICLDSSRLSKTLVDMLILSNDIRKTGAELVFVDGSFEDTPEGNLQMCVIGAMRELEEARKVSARTRARLHAAKEGS